MLLLWVTISLLLSLLSFFVLFAYTHSALNKAEMKKQNIEEQLKKKQSSEQEDKYRNELNTLLELAKYRKINGANTITDIIDIFKANKITVDDIKIKKDTEKNTLVFNIEAETQNKESIINLLKMLKSVKGVKGIDMSSVVSSLRIMNDGKIIFKVNFEYDN